MKNLLKFDEFVNEIKQYGQKISNEEFKNIKVGTEILYKGYRYLVKSNDEYTLKLEPINGGNSISVNFNMFNKDAAILEGISEVKFGKNRVVIFPGRFQPFHLGHIAAMKKCYNIFRLPVVPIQILSKTDKSPFDENLLNQMGHAVHKEYSKWMAGYILYPMNKKAVVPQMVKYAREAFDFEAIGMGAGSDRIKSYESQIRYLNSDISDVPISEPFRLEICDERYPGGPSGTKVREAIKNGDRDLFEQMTPKSIHKFYDELKKQME